MRPGDLVFSILVALAIPILLYVANSLRAGRVRLAWRILSVYLVLIAIYTTFLLTFRLALPIRVLTTYEAQYSGDWSVAVASIRRIPHDLDEDYEIDFRLSNRGSKVLNGPRGLVVYLLAEDGRRYDASPEPADPPFDTSVNPGKSVITTRQFVLPTNLNRVELVIARTGFQFAWFIIGRSSLDGHTVVLLQ
jgi:hypothetical protein